MKITLKYPKEVEDLTVSTVLGTYGATFNSATVDNGITTATWTVPDDKVDACLANLKQQEGVHVEKDESSQGHAGVQGGEPAVGKQDRIEGEEPSSSGSNRPFGAAKRK